MILTGENKYSEKNLSQCHSVRRESHIDLPAIEPGPHCYSVLKCGKHAVDVDIAHQVISDLTACRVVCCGSRWFRNAQM